MPGEKAAPHGAEIARSLFSSYLLPFEITMILLIVALFGAVLMVRRRADAP
jgi:NADH:ubiquinone oxidoreductase subunit 6 (subunit J)